MSSNNRAIQQSEAAGKKKLTAVTIGWGRGKKQFFVELEHDSRGAAILPQHVLDGLLRKAGVQHGQTYTVA